MTEKEKINQINQFLEEYNDYINSREIIGISIANDVILANKRRITYSRMELDEIEKKDSVQESIDSFFHKPTLMGNGGFFNYFHAIPYDLKYLYANPDEWDTNFLDYYHSCGIADIKNRTTLHDAIPVTHFDDFNGLFAPAIEQFKFNQTRKDCFMSLLEDLNQIKQEEPKLYIVLNHGHPMEGYFLMLLEYSNTLYLFRATDNS